VANFYIVGGYVRDWVMGVPAKDMDFAVEAESYDEMKRAILARNGKIYLERPEFLTIRGKIDWNGSPTDADFVLCRKDGYYSDGRHPDSVTPGKLIDDLSRRDFTMNAMAMSEDGKILDPFGGQRDIRAKLIDTVGDAQERFLEDALRMLRALRFKIVKDMTFSYDVHEALKNEVLAKLLTTVSVERMREELFKMFHHNSLESITLLESYPLVKHAVMTTKNCALWFKPTLEPRC
jgi:tRNA nucleotidyltransferase (CCA-adding enzyme)